MAFVLIMGTAIAYAALLGWDTTYDVDPVTQEVSGPYAAWQVLLLAAVVVGLTVWASWSGYFPVALWAIPLALVVAFIVVALRTEDQTGLFMVGALLMAIGSLAAVAIVGGLTLAVASGVRRSGSQRGRPWSRSRTSPG